jgi:hypothetical protein
MYVALCECNYEFNHITRRARGATPHASKAAPRSRREARHQIIQSLPQRPCLSGACVARASARARCGRAARESDGSGKKG